MAAQPRIGRRPPSAQRRGARRRGLQRLRGCVSALLAVYWWVERVREVERGRMERGEANGRGTVLLSPRTGAWWTWCRAAGARLGPLRRVRGVAGVPWVRAARSIGRGGAGLGEVLYGGCGFGATQDGGIAMVG